jgi:hypothetical protein
MSQTEYHIGKLVPVDLQGLPLEKMCQKICQEKGVIEISSLYESWEEQVKYDFYDQYYVVDGVIYSLQDHTEGSDESHFMNMRRESDGTIHFVTQFYNGGTCLSEMVEDGISRMNKNNANEYKE